MEKEQVREFANYEVYELVEGKYHRICLCETMEVACNIAKMFASMDPSGDSYYVTSINRPGDLVWGGGWYYEFYNKDGKVHQSSLM